MSIEARLIHWCRIATEQTSGAADAYGKFGGSATYASSRCLFAGGGSPKRLESGAFVEDVPTVILPAATAIVEGQKLVGLSAGFEHTYEVRKVWPVWTRVLDHLRCDLEVSP